MISAYVETGPCRPTGKKSYYILLNKWYGCRLISIRTGYCRCVHEGGPAHAKRFTFGVSVNTSEKGWTDECIGEPMPSVKKAKDSAAVLLLELLSKWYSKPSER